MNNYNNKVAVVTGANKGIGYAIVKELSKKFNGLVYLTARNEELGMKALKELTLNGENIQFHQLDIENQESIDKFANFIKEKHQGLDVLVNNAALLFPREFDIMIDPCPCNHLTIKNSPKYKDSHVNEMQATIRVNYFGTLNLCNALFPLLRPHARVVNVASDSGMLSYVKSEALRNRLTDEKATLQDISNIMNEFLEISKTKDIQSLGYPNTSYEFSKAGLISITRIQQRMFNVDPRPDIVINSVCPGFVSTDMTNNTGYITADQAAQTPVYLALLPENYSGPKGEFWKRLKIVNWLDLEYKWEDHV